ncbi:MarR family winged helix-turn-helix transcriptional regulator [Streptacidiphilus monticola]|jgi:DNA-binding MarR family transcriptional regulator|uniref:MarR family winged helix-turn-helix transcriptional regulator n=1 Tax=Streptacidiphilus monticola TaxID=2161674 RepID=A0ABW1G9H4_9ACTN
MAELQSSDEKALVEAWRELLARQAATACALDRELNERHGLGMSEFEVLERLVEGADGSCKVSFRVQELADSVHLSQSALSRLIGRLEKDGLVERSMCPEDRRGIQVCVTNDGYSRYVAAKPTHRAVLAEKLGD